MFAQNYRKRKVFFTLALLSNLSKISNSKVEFLNILSKIVLRDLINVTVSPST